MTRTFSYSFSGPGTDPVAAPTVSLSVTEIEDAAIREVLQGSGARLSSWSMLDQLLEPSIVPFRFIQPLGHAREVKVALSGLFGRFVARAYLTKHFGLTIFNHLGLKTFSLNRVRRIRVERDKTKGKGDLPDWLACKPNLSGLAVAEAKGSHAPKGPQEALARAKSQTERVLVFERGHQASIKRIAVSTRWGMTVDGPKDSQLAVYDPDEAGDSISPENWDALYIGLLRRHVASLIDPLGHGELAASLLRLVNARTHKDEISAQNDALDALNALPAYEVREGASALAIDGLVGGFVSRAGPIAEKALSESDRKVLERLELNPAFVGVERQVVKAAISGEASVVRSTILVTIRDDTIARGGADGTWVVPLTGGQRSIGIVGQ